MLKLGINEPETNTITGKPIEIGEKILYPVIQISILRNNEGNIVGVWIIPVAFVVEEDSERTLIFLNDENTNFEDINEILSLY